MEQNFPFIVSSGPKLQNDPATRQLIRKQAMRDIGIARKRKGTFGKQNTGQFPTADVPIRAAVSSAGGNKSSSSGTSSPETWGSDASASTQSTDDTELDALFGQQLVPARRKPITTGRISSIQTVNLLSSYETTRARFNVDITDLCMLTNFNVGKSIIPILTADPSRLAGLLGQQEWSYLQHVPSRYGESQCLTAATDCVLAKVRSVLAPQGGYEEVQLRLYAKALNSLQKAISNGASCMDSDVLCATQMLSLHEVRSIILQHALAMLARLTQRQLLDPSTDSAWSHHVNGSARIVKHRGVRRFTTEFEKALFAAHVGTMVTEALLDNEHCYLEEPEWTKLYLDMAQESDFLTDRAPLTLKIRLSMFAMPGETPVVPFHILFIH